MFVSGVNPDVDTKGDCLSDTLHLCLRCIKGDKSAFKSQHFFVFAFLIIAFAVIFFGNIKSFEFAPNSTFVTSDFSNIRSNVADCLIFAFLPVIFGFNSTSTKNLSIKQPVITTLIIFGTLMLTLFFADFVIGSYSAQQPFSVQLLSKTAYFGDMKGFDSFYLAAVTACIFCFCNGCTHQRFKLHCKHIFKKNACFCFYNCAYNVCFVCLYR